MSGCGCKLIEVSLQIFWFLSAKTVKSVEVKNMKDVRNQARNKSQVGGFWF